jgi:hypothetical protein
MKCYFAYMYGCHDQAVGIYLTRPTSSDSSPRRWVCQRHIAPGDVRLADEAKWPDETPHGKTELQPR